MGLRTGERPPPQRHALATISVAHRERLRAVIIKLGTHKEACARLGVSVETFASARTGGRLMPQMRD